MTAPGRFLSALARPAPTERGTRYASFVAKHTGKIAFAEHSWAPAEHKGVARTSVAVNAGQALDNSLSLEAGGRSEMQSSGSSQREELFKALDLVPSPNTSSRHDGQALSGLVCTVCEGAPAAGMCGSCIAEHFAEFRGHVIAPVTVRARELREQLANAACARVAGCFYEPSSNSGVLSQRGSGTSDSEQQIVAPLVACAQHKAAAVAVELDSLPAHDADAQAQLSANRDALIAAVHAAHATSLASLASAIVAKRVALETEADVADKAIVLAQTATMQAKAASALTDADLVAHAGTLLTRIAAACKAVDGIPVTLATSAFARISRPAIPQTLIEQALGTLQLEPSTAKHVHSPHCGHAAIEAFARRSPVKYSIADFAESFKVRNDPTLKTFDGASVAAALRPETIALLSETLVTKFSGMRVDHGADHGIDFTYPSQLLALSVALGMPGDILLCAGSGQGKSTLFSLIAAALLTPGLGSKAITPDRVFVLTPTDSLAFQGRACAEKLLSRIGIQSCVISDTALGFQGFASSQVVYANATKLDFALRRLQLQFLTPNESPLSADETAFIHVMYCLDPTSKYAVLIDDYDVVLDELRRLAPTPFVRLIPTALLSPADVMRHRDFCPELASFTPSPRTALDALTNTRTTYFYESFGDERYYNLVATTFELSAFLERAARVVGVTSEFPTRTGTPGSPDRECYYFPGRRSGKPSWRLVLPYSHDPALDAARIFPSDYDSPTPIIVGSCKDQRGAGIIWCHTRAVISDTSSAATSNNNVPSEHAARQWVERIIEDISAIRVDGLRHVLVVVPTSDRYYNVGDGTAKVSVETPPSVESSPASREPLRESLLKSLRNVFAVENITEPQSTKDLRTTRVAKHSGSAGSITIVDEGLAMGLDIVQGDHGLGAVPGGLHVVVATDVKHKSALRHLIGRTGRFGQEGSFSIVVLDRILSAPAGTSTASPATTPPLNLKQWWKAAVHVLSSMTASFVRSAAWSYMSTSDRTQWAQKFLMLVHSCTNRGMQTAGQAPPTRGAPSGASLTRITPASSNLPRGVAVLRSFGTLEGRGPPQCRVLALALILCQFLRIGFVPYTYRAGDFSASHPGSNAA